MVNLNLKTILQHVFSAFMGLFFVLVGIKHFTDPVWFEPIVPAILGNSRIWVYISGVPAVFLGVAILIPKYRTWAGPSIAVLLIILYWANLNMWINNIPLNGQTYATTWHVLRGLAQIILISIAFWLSDWSIFIFVKKKAKHESYDQGH